MALARSCALLPVTAWKPVLMLATEQREWHVSHCRKYRRVSFCRMVSGERQVWHVTYSSAGERRTVNNSANNTGVDSISHFSGLQLKFMLHEVMRFEFVTNEKLHSYSLIYLLNTFSICFCWNLPLITSWLFPSIEPLEKRHKSRTNIFTLSHRKASLTTITQIVDKNSVQTVHYIIILFTVYLVPSSANRKARRCLGWRCNL